MALGENILQFFRSDILSLRQFEDVFDAINNFNRSIWENLTNVAGAEPAIFVECLSSLLGELVVTRCDSGSIPTDFTLRIGLVGAQVLHFRDIS
jgi:hypothetical protein